ncbi:MAG: 3D-(3,5/4)-trihydroxycyclohexane-1,2-dione acylhydrolase (decyclizing) [Xanthomonadales bacterium]|nr:3D-(3,5/4)-trihydroxycyclohexane-1,2-dione acylhydrolase (decyclizing) [Xanthomonadales bacterium]
MGTTRLTMAQALVKYLVAQKVEIEDEIQPLVPAVWSIFGHGNVAGLGEALYQQRESLPTLRAHNEQAMTLAAVAFAKTRRRRQFMACTTSIGPGATNMVTAAAVAHVNRLPVLLLPGDSFATRAPDPVLQQIENFNDPNITANDCFKPVSRYWDRINRPEQLLDSLPRAFQVLTDPARCGPVTLCMPQDVQTEAWDYPASFFEQNVHRPVRPEPDRGQLERALERVRASRRPLIVAGGGVHYAQACDELAAFASSQGIPVAETQAGKGALRWDHPMAVGAIGVTGTSAANTLAAEADLVIAIGTRLQDFTTASRSLFEHPGTTIIGLNTCVFDSGKHHAVPLVADARRGLESLATGLQGRQSATGWLAKVADLKAAWNQVVAEAFSPDAGRKPSDAEVIGAVHRAAGDNGTVVCAAGGLPGELHALWQNRRNDDYHLEYGYSCMGYEIPGGMAVKMADPSRDVYVMVGDGSYLMMNSEIATSVAMGLKLVVVVLNNHGFACINRLQQACGGAPFNNLWKDVSTAVAGMPDVDFAAHAASLGAASMNVTTIAELDEALESAREFERTVVIALETDHAATTGAGGAWWDVAVPESSGREAVLEARDRYVEAKKKQGR